MTSEWLRLSKIWGNMKMKLIKLYRMLQKVEKEVTMSLHKYRPRTEEGAKEVKIIMDNFDYLYKYMEELEEWIQ